MDQNLEMSVTDNLDCGPGDIYFRTLKVGYETTFAVISTY